MQTIRIFVWIEMPLYRPHLSSHLHVSLAHHLLPPSFSSQHVSASDISAVASCWPQSLPATIGPSAGREGKGCWLASRDLRPATASAFLVAPLPSLGAHVPPPPRSGSVLGTSVATPRSLAWVKIGEVQEPRVECIAGELGAHIVAIQREGRKKF